MLTLKQIKKDMQFNQELGGLVDVLKGIASAHFRHLQTRREYFSRFMQTLDSFFEMVSFAKTTHPFIKPRSSENSGKSCIMIVTSDEGFLGDLNSRVINAGMSQYKAQDELIVIGERGAHSLEDMGESFFYFPGIPEDIDYKQAFDLRDYLIQQYLKKKFSRVIMVYPEFISFTHQHAKAEQLLPYKRLVKTESRIPKAEILIEPSERRIIDYLIRIWMAQQIYDILWESKLSELASRVVHLEGSSQVVSETSKKLQLSYFRTVHQLSDKNIREIVASRLIK